MSARVRVCQTASFSLEGRKYSEPGHYRFEHLRVRRVRNGQKARNRPLETNEWWRWSLLFTDTNSYTFLYDGPSTVPNEYNFCQCSFSYQITNKLPLLDRQNRFAPADDDRRRILFFLQSDQIASADCYFFKCSQMLLSSSHLLYYFSNLSAVIYFFYFFSLFIVRRWWQIDVGAHLHLVPLDAAAIIISECSVDAHTIAFVGWLPTRHTECVDTAAKSGKQAILWADVAVWTSVNYQFWLIGGLWAHTHILFAAVERQSQSADRLMAHLQDINATARSGLADKFARRCWVSHSSLSTGCPYCLSRLYCQSSFAAFCLSFALSSSLWPKDSSTACAREGLAGRSLPIDTVSPLFVCLS